MRLPDFLRTSTFRLAASFAVLFALSVIVLFAFIYWQTALHETARIDRFLVNDATLIARQSEPEVHRAVSQRNLGDLHRITYAALFDSDGRPLAGNLSTLPPDPNPCSSRMVVVGYASAAAARTGAANGAAAASASAERRFTIRTPRRRSACRPARW